MAKKYIVGDWVKFLFEESKVIEVYEDGSYYMDSPNITGCPKEEELSPIPLVPAILEKNGWKKEKDGIVYSKNVSETIYFRLIGKNYGWTLRCGNLDLIKKVEFVHELQHLLFGLGLNSEMKV